MANQGELDSLMAHGLFGAPDKHHTRITSYNVCYTKLLRGKILCVGRNYRAYHEVAEDGKVPEWPSILGGSISQGFNFYSTEKGEVSYNFV